MPDAMPPTPSDGWFDEIARALGPRYWAPGTSRVMAFTTGTSQEVDFLVDELGLEAGMRILDLGCGPGRHTLELAKRGMEVVGVDRSREFVDLAIEAATSEGLSATFRVADVRAIGDVEAFDAAICLCQGGFGLLGGSEDSALIARFGRALRPGGMLALSAFSSYFAVGALEAGETFDAATGVLYERTTLQDQAGVERTFDLWTTCFTPRELRMLASAAGLEAIAVYAVRPGRYGANPPDLEHPEHLLIARRPRGSPLQT